jgi:thiamine-monophosphate kinase
MIWSKGERGLVRRINSFFEIEEDDCSVLPLGLGNEKLLLTTDAASASSDFPPGSDPRSMGWYSLAINISDIAAMGGRPLGALLSIVLPDMREEEFSGILDGIQDCSSAYSTRILGGDTSYGEELSITGTCVGLASRPLRRKGLRPGDLLGVTGYLGRGGARRSS